MNKYYIDQINSSKAYQFTSYWHYSNVGFKKAILNLGIFRKEDNLLVGVMQWGCSYQDKIRLDRYVKEPIDKSEYLELNRFSMADSEGPNSESQAISLGIKWIKRNWPQIRLLVSYAGRKKGNYGFIYQATNWEYLGYFVSNGFWLVDGKECHLTTLWDRYKRHGDPNVPFTQGICDMYHNVIETWTKQFIYIQRLDKTLTPATPILPYPKEYNVGSIIERVKVWKDTSFTPLTIEKPNPPKFYWEKEERLFSLQALARRGEYQPKKRLPVAIYNAGGELEMTYPSATAIHLDGYTISGIRNSLNNETIYKNKYFRHYDGQPASEIEVPYVCVIDEIPFSSFAEAGRYLQVSRQAVQQAWRRGSKAINKHEVQWVDR